MKVLAKLPRSQGDIGSVYKAAKAHYFKELTQPKIVFQNALLKSNNPIVFLVDDDRIFLKTLEHSIKKEHPQIEVRTFQTGEACLQQMKLKPAVVILDYFLNSTVTYAWNGLTILRQIKKISPKTKIIMLSAQDSLDVAMKCIDSGAFDYISKSESSYVKINNMLSNILDNIKLNKEGLKPYQLIFALAVIIFIICLIYKA